MAKTPTIEDVARLAGVSRQTVSNAVNNPHRLKEETRLKVDQAIQQLGYKPNLGARRLRTRKSSTTGVRLDSYAGGISGTVLDRFIHSLTEQCAERGVRVLVYAANDPDEELFRLEDLFDTGEIDSVVLTGTHPGDIRPHWLKARGCNFVTFGRPWGNDDFEAPSHRWVDVDGASGTAQATTHALKNVGPGVAFLGWPTGSATGDDRERGWEHSLQSSGTRPGCRLTSMDDVDQARGIVAAALSDGILERTDSVICASDTLAVGAKLACLDQGESQLAVYGFDNTPTAQALGISSIEQQTDEVSDGVVSLLLEEHKSRDYVLVTPTLVAR